MSRTHYSTLLYSFDTLVSLLKLFPPRPNSFNHSALIIPVMEAKNATISLATEVDLLTLGQILIEAHGPEAVMASFFEDWPSITTMLPSCPPEYF
jgi:hypothetical protein